MQEKLDVRTMNTYYGGAGQYDEGKFRAPSLRGSRVLPSDSGIRGLRHRRMSRPPAKASSTLAMA